jgi:hypothetical protein
MSIDFPTMASEYLAAAEMFGPSGQALLRCDVQKADFNVDERARAVQLSLQLLLSILG